MKANFRVKSKQDFSRVIDLGEKIRNKDYFAHVLKTDNGYIRVGVAVSSKVGSAVERNRQKRRLRALLDNLIDYQNGSYDIVVIAKLSFKEKSYRENKDSLKLLLKDYL